jgi:cytidylate kinase
MWNDVRIAISGKSGCGNSTVSRLLADRLGIRLINYTFHDMARSLGISFEELCRLAEEDSRYDIQLDEKLKAMASEPGCVLGSRLAIWLLDDADLKIYLEASPEVRARRIAKREGAGFDRAFDEMVARDERDRNRYIRLYRIDNDDHRFADLIIDTDPLDQFAEVDLIMEALRKRKSGAGEGSIGC